MTTKLNEDGAIGLAGDIFPHLESYAEEHGASSTVLDGLWALAHLSAYLICSHGVNADAAKKGFLRALDHAIACSPPEDNAKIH